MAKQAGVLPLGKAGGRLTSWLSRRLTGETARFICSFYLSLESCTSVSRDQSLKCASPVASTVSYQRSKTVELRFHFRSNAIRNVDLKKEERKKTKRKRRRKKEKTKRKKVGVCVWLF